MTLPMIRPGLGYRSVGMVLLAASGLLAGCDAQGGSQFGRIGAAVDSFSFAHFGTTVYERPSVLTLKEIHLSGSQAPATDVIVEGHVERVSEHGTYLILTDESARLLVVLTELDPTTWSQQAVSAKSLRVMGRIESGKKGLPILKAHALGLSEAAAKAADSRA